MTDHLDSSPSETVRRHAATFRRARAAGPRGEERVQEDRDERGYVEGTAADVDGDGLRVLGARGAASVAAEATAAGWRVIGRYAAHRRESDGASVDAVVVMAMWFGEDGRATHWAMGHWRTTVISPPMKRSWKFTGAAAEDPDGGIRPVGARELAALVSAGPIEDRLSDE